MSALSLEPDLGDAAPQSLCDEHCLLVQIRSVSF